MSPWLMIPFAGLLLSIAILPLAAPSYWKSHKNKAGVSLLWALPTLFYLCFHLPLLTHSLSHYFSFITLIGSLFVISGGICLTGDLRATPSVNLAFLGLGSILANLIGTTGASMLLIRPLLKTNSERKHTWHLPLFFIFMVSNMGGLLTPMGDPPLFLGYLSGVPFHWTLTLFPVWMVALTFLGLLFYGWDSWAYRREEAANLRWDESARVPLRLRGAWQFLLLAGVVGSLFLPSPWRETVMIAASVISYKSTPAALHRENHFSFHPISEIAILFAGIFITMAPVLEILRNEGGTWGLSRPWEFFWVTGALSSVLDNAPTYLAFFNLAQGLHLGGGIAGVPDPLLQAISIGAVFMGANSYIGNGPNFMVKAIAEEQGLKMPGFAAYMLYAALILGPLYLLLTWMFF